MHGLVILSYGEHLARHMRSKASRAWNRRGNNFVKRIIPWIRFLDLEIDYFYWTRIEIVDENIGSVIFFISPPGG